MEKTVCFFGIYDRGYARNRVFEKGFAQCGWRVLHCHADPKRFTGASKYVELYRQYRRLRRERVDLVLVAFPGHTVVWLARLLWGRRIVFDAFLSLYDSNVLDRRVHAEGSIRAHLDRFWDKLSCRLAGVVLLDTAAHIDYFAGEYGLPREKFVRAFIGTDLEPFESAPLNENLVHFHGTFIPLHGIEVILAAAHELADTSLRFTLVGRGQEYWRMGEIARTLQLANVTFAEPVRPEALPATIAPAAMCLGVFGASLKTSRVIPNKIYEYLAMGKAMVTADTAGIRELEALGMPLPILLVPAADPHALAAAIRTLAQNKAQREELARSARAFHKAHLTPQAVVERLLADLHGRVHAI